MLMTTLFGMLTPPDRAKVAFEELLTARMVFGATAVELAMTKVPWSMRMPPTTCCCTPG